MPETVLAEADYVIVGGGTAGCVLADRLSASGRYKVVLIEAGGHDWSPWIHIPLGYGKLFDHPRYDWRLKTVPQPQLEGRQIAVPRGRVLGGSSSTNGLLYVRGQAEDFDAWAEAGNRGWSFREVLPYFIRSEDQQHGPSDFHGVRGPLAVRDPTAAHPLAEAFIAAAGEQGVPRTNDFNGASQEGAGYYQMTVRGIRRCSTATSYLRRARGRPNLRVITQAFAERIKCRNGRVTGVRIRRGDTSFTVEAQREVILAAGAIASPQLLMLSGIGPSGPLRSLDIEIVAERPSVGVGLQDHLNVRTSYRCSLPITMNDRLRTPLGRLIAGAEYFLRGTGPLTVAAGYAGAFYRSRPSESRPDMQAILLLFSTDKTGKTLLPKSGFMASAYQLRPLSRGGVRLASPDPRTPPLIDPAYLERQEDRLTLLAGLKRMQAMLGSPALHSFMADAGEPPLGCSDDEMAAHIRERASAGHHFVGSCAMGPGGEAVVDPQLRVRGIRDLRIVDGSVMPSIISGNTNAAIVMIAEKGADMILADAERERSR